MRDILREPVETSRGVAQAGLAEKFNSLVKLTEDILLGQIVRLVDPGGGVHELALVPVPDNGRAEAFQRPDDLLQPVVVRDGVQIQVDVHDRFRRVLQEVLQILGKATGGQVSGRFVMDSAQVERGWSHRAYIAEGLVRVDQQQVGLTFNLEQVGELGAKVLVGDSVLQGDFLGVVVEAGGRKEQREKGRKNS